MFLKVTRSGPRQYLQLVEAFRDEAGKAKHRTLVTLGRLDRNTGDLDSVISGLLKVTGRSDFLNTLLPPVEFESARALGNVWALNELRETLARKFGMAKEGLIARQIMVGVVQTGEGLPIYHEVFAGNTAESPTLLPTLKTVLERYPSIRRVVLAADRGLLSLDNLEALAEIRLDSGEPLEFVAVPGRRYSEFTYLLRLVVAHNPQVATEVRTLRHERIAALEAQAAAWVGKLDAQDAGVKARGKKLSDSAAKARLYHAVKEGRLAHIVRAVLKNELFSYDIDHDALALAELMDGKLLLVTNCKDLSAQGIVDRYKSLADIERGFRVLKSEIEIGPVFYRLPERIKAHVSICFIALILYRVMH
jgi:transposase